MSNTTDTTTSTNTKEIEQEVYKEVEESRQAGILSTVNRGVNAIQGYVVIPDA
jgi:hypothetical protein